MNKDLLQTATSGFIGGVIGGYLTSELRDYNSVSERGRDGATGPEGPEGPVGSHGPTGPTGNDGTDREVVNTITGGDSYALVDDLSNPLEYGIRSLIGNNKITHSQVIPGLTGPLITSYGNSGQSVNFTFDQLSMGPHYGTKGENSDVIIGKHLSVDNILGNDRNIVSIGLDSGRFNQQSNSIAIGFGSGFSEQSSNSIAIGYESGSVNQGENSVAIGYQSGYTGQKDFSIAVGREAGSTGQGIKSIAIGHIAGSNNQGGNTGNSIAIGSSAGNTNQGENSIAIGNSAGYSGQGISSIAIGISSGFRNQGNYSISIGTESGNTGQGLESVAIGMGSGKENQGGNTGHCVSLGAFCGEKNQGHSSIAIGHVSGNTNQGNFSIAIGSNSGFSGQVNNSVCLGKDSTIRLEDETVSMEEGLNFNPFAPRIAFSLRARTEFDQTGVGADQEYDSFIGRTTDGTTFGSNVTDYSDKLGDLNSILTGSNNNGKGYISVIISNNSKRYRCLLPVLQITEIP